MRWSIVLHWLSRLLLPVCLALPAASALAEQADEETDPGPEARCSCLWQGSFSDVQAGADLVISGEVVARKGNSIDLEVADILRGTEYQNPVRIWLRARNYCRPDADDFPPGSEWVMALTRIEEVPPGGFDPATPNISYGRERDYYLPDCGGYWLQLRGGRVTGNLVDAPRWDHQPKMTPVLLDLVAAFVAGDVGADALLEASKADPALRELMLDTRQFLRHGETP